MSWAEAVFRWYGVLLLATWAFAPLALWLCAFLNDRGVSVARPFSLLAMVFPTWLLTSLGLIQFGGVAIISTLVLAGLVGWISAIRASVVTRSWLRSMVVVEVISLILFLAYLGLRGFTPAILGTEKPMDVAFLASSARTLTMPPIDPWFAGQPINYYYLGYLLFGAVGRLAGVTPSIGFNLALGAVFSMTVVAAGGMAWNVVRLSYGSRAAAVAAVAAAFLLAIAGNLYAAQRLWQGASETFTTWWWDSAVGIGWRSSRIVCDGPRVGNLCPSPSVETINEFPFFSFLLGDLHPHLMALPYTLLALALAWNLFCLGRASTAQPWSWWLRVALSGAVIGALYPMNAWDLPIYLLLAAMAVASARAPRAWRFVALLLAAAVVPWLPFVRNYTPPTLPLERVPEWLGNVPVLPRVMALVALHVGERTSVGEYLTMFGIPYAFGIALLAVSLRRENVHALPASKPLIFAIVGISILGVILSAPVLVLCGVPALIAVSLLKAHHDPEPVTFALAALTAAWGLSILVEIVYVRDLFDSRMNTLFKFYYQSWTLYALATAVSLPILWQTVHHARTRLWKPLLGFSTVAALVLGLAYPVVASYQWTEKFAHWDGLDGLSYGMELDPDDVAAIRWLAANAAPGDVLLEAAGCSYRPFGRLPFDRYSAFTGVATVIGWDGHERQWRAGMRDDISAIEQRQRDVIAMYDDPQSPLFAAYGVDWLVVGNYESGNWQADCPAAGPYTSVERPGYPGEGWTEAFASGGTRIYQRTTER